VAGRGGGAGCWGGAGAPMSTDSQETGGSRLSKTNRAVHDGAEVGGPTARQSLKQPLTERNGVGLRTEVLREDAEGLRPTTWRDAVWDWRNWYKETRDAKAVFENGDGETIKGSDPNRFHPDYSDKQYAKLKDLERGIREDYGKRLHTAMLTLTASSTGGVDGEAVPPVDHLDELLSSWDAVRRALSHSLEGRRWERLAILEPHKSGYLHVHVAVFVDGKVTREDFAPVIDAHLRNCELAERDAHDLDDDGTISVRYAGGDRDGEDALDELAIYLSDYLGTFDGDPLDAPQNQQMANAVLWATGRQRWRPSNGAQEYMRTEVSEASDDWDLVGIEDGSGEVHEVAAGGARAPVKLETFMPDAPPPD